MSTRGICKTSFSDRSLLVDALKEIYGPDGVLVEGESERIGVRIPGLYGDGEFIKGTDGTYAFNYDSTDRRKFAKIIPAKKGDKTVSKLAQTYSKLKVVRDGTAALKGTIVSDTLEGDGKIRLRMRIVTYGEG